MMTIEFFFQYPTSKKTWWGLIENIFCKIIYRECIVYETIIFFSNKINILPILLHVKSVCYLLNFEYKMKKQNVLCKIDLVNTVKELIFSVRIIYTDVIQNIKINIYSVSIFGKSHKSICEHLTY